MVELPDNDKHSGLLRHTIIKRVQVLFPGPGRCQSGSAKADGREPKTCLCRVFKYKLGCFDDVHVFIYVDARPHLLLKTQPRFSPDCVC
jgi:hypothetical protein